MSGWMDRIMAAVGLGGRKAEADVSYEPAHDRTRAAEDTTTGAQPDPKFEGLPAGDPGTETTSDADDTTPAQHPGGP